MTHDYSYLAVLKRWLRKALQPGASYTAKQMARCQYILCCDDIGELATRREIEQIAGLVFPGFLAGVYAEYQRIRADMDSKTGREKSGKVGRSERASLAA